MHYVWFTQGIFQMGKSFQIGQASLQKISTIWMKLHDIKLNFSFSLSFQVCLKLCELHSNHFFRYHIFARYCPYLLFFSQTVFVHANEKVSFSFFRFKKRPLWKVGRYFFYDSEIEYKWNNLIFYEWLSSLMLLYILMTRLGLCRRQVFTERRTFVQPK